jgi:RNase P subunit RPR2
VETFDYPRRFHPLISEPIKTYMKKRKDVEVHLRYLFNISVGLLNRPEIYKRKIKHMYELSKKKQARLSKEIKRSICSRCSNILVPTLNCRSRIVKYENGMFMETVCECLNVKRYALRGEKGIRRIGLNCKATFLD